MNAITEAGRQEFLQIMEQADSDAHTTGVFVYLLAPRRNGLAREAVLTAGTLPVGAVLARMIPVCRARLEQHAKTEKNGR